MNSRQKHGFFFEEYIIKKYNLQKEQEYHHQYDAYTTDKLPVQIKFIKEKSSIELGCYTRIRDNDRDYLLIIGFWTNITKVYKEYLIEVKVDNFKKLLPILSNEKEMFLEFNNFSCDKSQDREWKVFIKKYKTNTVVQLRFKRDHKKQKRIQCAIPYKKFIEFLSNFEYTYNLLNEELPKIFRNYKEQYYTNKRVAIDLVKRCKSLNLFNVETVVEPSAGTGVFLDSIKESGFNKNLIAFDIEPKHPLVAKQDFLNTGKSIMKNALVIGNPPFGAQSCIAKKFIKHCEQAKYIAFILAKSFLKESMSKCFPKYFHKIYETVLPDNSFVFNGNEYSVPCVFLVYEKKDFIRPLPIKVKPNLHYNYKLEDGSIAFKRVGGCAGQFRYSSLDKLSPQSHIFIKFNKYVDPLLLDNLVWNSSNNTCGPKSISKKELTIALNKLTELE